MGYGKKNTIKIDPLSYNIGLIGESGIGKTTIIKEMCEKLVGEDGYRFLECGKEDGADGINGINYLNCPEWSMDYDEETNSIGFEDFAEDSGQVLKELYRSTEEILWMMSLRINPKNILI